MHTLKPCPAVSTAAVSLAVALSLLVAACGSGSEGSSDTTKAVGSQATTAESSAPTTIAADYAKFCDTWLKIDATPSPGGPDGPPAAGEVKKYADSLKPDVAILVAEAPAALTATVKAVSSAVDEASATDKSDPLESDDFGTEAAKGETWLHDNCGYQPLDVTAVDYAYKGVPSTLKAGKTSLLLVNKSQGHEAHEMILVRRKAGVTDKAQDLLALPDDQAFSKVDFVGAAFAPPEATSGLQVDLEPGGYISVCFLPVGGAEGNPPHFSKGMVAEFTVA